MNAEVELELREFDVEQIIEDAPEVEDVQTEPIPEEVQEQEIQTQEEVDEDKEEIQEEKVDYAIETKEYFDMWLYLQKNKK